MSIDAELADAKIRVIAAATPARDVYWEIDLRSGRVTWGDQAAAFFGIDDIAECGFAFDRWLGLVHPSDQVRLADEMTEMLLEPVSGFSTECRLKVASGDYIPASVRVLTVLTGPGGEKRIIGVTSDMRPMLNADRTVRKIDTALMHVSGQRGMETMARTFAHEINQPLAAIANYLGALGRMVGSTEFDHDLLMEAVDLAKDSVQRSSNIVRALRSVVERQETAAGLVELRSMVEDAAAYVMGENGESGDIDFAIEVPRHLVVFGDRSQLQQVMVSLLRNGLSALEKSAVKVLRVVANAGEHAVRLEVVDSSNGTLLGQPFEGLIAGTPNMGMSMIRTIVEAHDGHIWPEEVPDGGMKFIVELPLAA